MGAISEATTTQSKEVELSAFKFVEKYEDSFARVLPSHVKPATWVRLTQSALKKGQWDGENKRYLLESCALNNPAVFMASLLDAARLGLAPGTEQYYLTPRKVKGRWEILGIIGYQGMIELIYRAGAVASVIVEVVRAKDLFNYKPGFMEIPEHTIDWDLEDRGELKLVYAYAKMNGGATSKVVVLNKADIAKIKAFSIGSSGEHSPWQKHPQAMWMKSAVRQLYKWVPTSAEYRRELLRSAQEVALEMSDQLGDRVIFKDGLDADVMPHEEVDLDTGEIHDAEVVEGPVLTEEEQTPETGLQVPPAAPPAVKGRGRQAQAAEQPPIEEPPFEDDGPMIPPR